MAGYRLDDLGSVYSWRDLMLLVRKFRATPGSMFQAAIDGFKAPTFVDELIAEIYDLVAAGNWQRGGKATAAKPNPIPRPWRKPVGKSFGKDPIPASEFDSWWGRAR